ncbi:MAG TPA: phosphatase PAP2 family protein [Gaiellales bacterium]|nr:phosphatase PAP2 family protein [Gaiellales bacterium]
MPVIALLVVSAAAGLLAWRAASAALGTWWGRAPGAAVARELREHGRVARFVRGRLDAEVATGLALTLALAAIAVAGILVGVLALLVRRSDALAGVDSSAARWAQEHNGAATHRILQEVTNLASTEWVVVIAVVVGAVEWARVPSRWIPAYLTAVTLGDSLVTNAVKDAVDRARPAIDPVAATLGPSFPSGHSSTAAAFFAALALLAGRRRTHARKAALAGLAAGTAVAVACSRVLLDLHWLSDVIGGLALGWGWFALCTAAFGGWLVKFGAPVEAAAAQPARARDPSASTRV